MRPFIRRRSATDPTAATTLGRRAAADRSTTSRARTGRGSWMLLAVLGLLTVACLGKLAVDSTGVAPVSASALAQTAGHPVNDPNGPIGGAGTVDDCVGAGMIPVGESGLCTHGPDPIPDGVDVNGAGDISGAGGAPAIDCIGDGQSGSRVQVLYVRPSNVPSRASSVRDGIRTVAGFANQIYRDSAAETGGYRSIRFVHDDACRIMVEEVAITPTALLGNANFGNMITQLEVKGYGRTDRMYMIFMDANVRISANSDDLMCGIGTYWEDDRDTSGNDNNSGPAYGRVDRTCWYPDVAAHELMHNLGAVQPSAPHSTAYGHCYDEWEVMCYDDGPGTRPMQQVCTPDYPRDYSLFDCNNDDYFHTNPSSGSYLGRHWNAADNRFLIGAGTTGPRLGTLTLSKEKSKFNGLVEASVTGLKPNSSVTLRWPRAFEITSGPNDGEFTTGLDTATTDAQGRASFSFLTPLEPYGDYEVTARDPNGGEAVATLRVIPRILLNETEGPTDTNLRVYFYGFAPSERIEVRWHASGSATSSYRVVMTLTVASNGRASSLVTIPSSTGTGDRLVVGKVIGVRRSASTPFEVTAGGGGSVDDGSATPTRTATITATSEPSPSGTVVPDATATATEGPTATATSEPTATAEPIPTETAVPTEEPTATPVPNASPVAVAGEDQTVTDADGTDDEPVALDGGGSTDPEDGPLTLSWTVDGVEIASGVDPTVTLPIGSTTVVLTVTDDVGATAADDVVVTVEPAPVDEA